MSQNANKLDLSNLDMWTEQQMRDTIMELENEKSDIDFQIASAKRRAMAEGKWADHTWLINAEYAGRKKGIQIRTLQHALGRKREEKKQLRLARIERYFISQAQAMLDVETYERIMQAAIAEASKVG